MTGDAAKFALARAIALAQRHGVVMIDVVLRGGRLPRGWNHKDRQRVVEWRSRANVLVRLSGLENSHIACLMASHADVVRQIGSEASRIDDHGIGRGTLLWPGDSCATHELHVGCSGAVASLAANGEFGKRCLFEFSVSFWNGIRPSAVTGDAPGGDGTIEP